MLTPLLSSFMVFAQAAPVLVTSPQLAPGASLVVRQNAAQPLQNLQQALPSMSWRAETQGVLLVVGSESVQIPDFQKRAMRGDWPKVPSPGTMAVNVAALFEYGVEKVGSLSVFFLKKVKRFLGAPDTPPESAEPMEDYEVARELGRSLDANQWKQMASESGLGIDGLNPAQQKMYLQLLPDPIRLRPQGGDGTYSREPVELTPDQRRQIRVVLDRNLQVNFVAQGKENSFYGFGAPPGRDQKRFYLETYGNERNRATELVAPLVPNSKLKPGDLNFASRSLDERVSLKDINNVGELIGRIRDATGQPNILADARLHARSVKVWGDEARAGDVLKALCRAFGGTFRRVGEGDEALYVLTDDRVGLGTRMAAYQSWRSLGQMIRSAKQQEELDKSAASLDFKALTSLDDPWDLPSSTLSGIEKPNFGLGKWEDRLTSVSSLPQSLQTFVQSQVKQNSSMMTDDGSGPQPVSMRTDKVSLQSSYRVQLLIPGMGKTDAWQLSSLASGPMMADFRRNPDRALESVPDEALRFPDKWKERAVLARPTTAEECASVAKAARAAGFGAIWIDLPTDIAEARTLLTAATAAARAEGLDIGAQVSVFETSVPDASLDLTVLGEPSNAEPERMARAMAGIKGPTSYAILGSAVRRSGVYLEPNPATYDVLTRQLTLLARTPGLSALVLTSLTPPGYSRQSASVYYGATGSDLGYTLKNRLAFLQQESLDPIDLAPNADSRLVPEAFADNGPNYIDLGGGKYGPDPSYRNRNQLWGELRAKTVEGFTQPLYRQLREAAPALRLFVGPSSSPYGNGTYYGEWQKADARQVNVGNPWDDSQKIVRAHSFSSYILNQLPYNYPLQENDEKRRELYRKAFRMSLLQQAKQFGPAGLTWNGFVADVTRLRVAEIPAALLHYKEDPK